MFGFEFEPVITVFYKCGDSIQAADGELVMKGSDASIVSYAD